MKTKCKNVLDFINYVLMYIYLKLILFFKNALIPLEILFQFEK